MKYILIAVIALAFILGAQQMLQPEADLVDESVSKSENKTTDDKNDTSAISQTPAASGETIDLSGQGLTKVPDSVFKETRTEVLDLSNNNLEGALQAEVRHLSNLRTLDLSDNNFTGVPAEVGQLSKLEMLDLSNNPLTGLPYEIGNLKNLKVLDLRGTNYATQDLEIIRQGLPSSVQIIVD